MKKLLLLPLATLLAGAADAQTYLADTAFTTDAGAGGARASSISKPIGNNFGLSMNKTTFFAMGEDFTVPAGQTWKIDTVIVYGYQTGGSTTSPFTDVSLQIRQGSVTGTSMYGDTTTNVLTSSGFSGIYRVDTTASSGGVTSTQRPIMYLKVKVAPTLSLTAGTYWLIWSAAGNSSLTGPWCPPKVLPGRINPGGQNGMQRVSGVWKAAKDSTSPTEMQNLGFNFILKGSSPSAIGQVAALDADLQLVPNMVQSKAVIRFNLSERTQASLKIFNVSGQLVTIVMSGDMNAGRHEVPFDASDLAAGTYFCELQASGGKQLTRLQVVK